MVLFWGPYDNTGPNTGPTLGTIILTIPHMSYSQYYPNNSVMDMGSFLGTILLGTILNYKRYPCVNIHC